MVESKIMLEEINSTNDKNFLAIFNEKALELLECRFIVSEIRIASMLKCIITIPALVECVKNTLDDFSYISEFKKNTIILSEDNEQFRGKLSLPVDRARLFTFVFCLLAEIDGGKIDASRFLQDFYYHEDTNVSFERFKEEVIKPFKKAGEYLLREIDPESLDVESSQRGEEYFKAEKIYINSSVYEQIITKLHFFDKKLSSEVSANSQLKLEAREISEGLRNALMSKNPKVIRLMWIAFRNVCERFRGVDMYVKDIGLMLSDNNLL